jgi:hypothetical protein
MLQLEALTAFSSAIEARAELEKIIGDASQGASPAGLQTAISRHQGGEQPRAPMPHVPSGGADTTLSMDALDAALSQHMVAPARATGPGRPPISVRETTATVTAGPRVDLRKSSALAALDLEPLAAPPSAEANVSLPDMPPLQSPRTQLSVPELPPLPLTKGDPSPALPVLAPEEPVKAPRLTVLDLRPLPEPLQASRTAEIPDVPSLPLASQSAREPARLTRLDRQLFGQPQRAESTSLPESRDNAGRTRESAAAPRSGLDANQQEPAPAKKGSRLWKWLGGAAILPGLVVGGAITAKRVGTTAPLGQTGTLVLTTNPDGARALVDGELRGVTPLTVELSTGMHEVELQGAGAPRTIPVTIGAGVKVSQFVELTTDPSTESPPGHPDAALARGEPASTHPPAASTHPPAATTQPPAAPSQSPAASPASQQPSGWISVSSPFPVRILERGRPLAYAQGASVTLSAGRHEIELVNDELGFREHRTLDVKSGQGVTVQLEAPKATVSLNALPWAEVLIDGESVGETPIGNLSLTVGPHNVLFRHPDLGERRQAVVVTLKSPLRISVDLRKK